MDKTRNKIFVGCLALLLVMVAGYALFSQNLNITGTAKAQGDFSLAITCQPGIPDNLKNIADFQIENGYYDDSCTVNGNNLNYQVSFKWPGARRYFIVKVKNTGSIDAIPNFNEDNITGKFCYDFNENGEFESDECDRPIYEGIYTMGVEMYLSEPFAVEDKNGNILTDLSEEQTSKFYTESGDFIIRSGYSAYFVVNSGLIDYGYKNSENRPASFFMKLNFNTKITYTQLIVK